MKILLTLDDKAEKTLLKVKKYGYIHDMDVSNKNKQIIVALKIIDKLLEQKQM
ncbi:MAG: hypothetical protein WCH21_07280 [Bacteroidota bacterium]|jgi:hypothetical protein